MLASAPIAERLTIALINMPWARIDAPSIQCGILKPLAYDHGHVCEVHYLNLDLASLVGPSVYNGISDLQSDRLHLLGEWLFSYAAFGEVSSVDEYLQEFPELETTWAELTRAHASLTLRNLRSSVLPSWLDQVASRPCWRSYDLVGFTSTFLQNTASLALGRRLKDISPDQPHIYGGANFDGIMGVELMRAIPWIDMIAVGESERSFPKLLNTLHGGQPLSIEGIVRRSDLTSGTSEHYATASVADLENSPLPDYAEYFGALARLGRDELLPGDRPKLLVEFSRGCWWGEKHNCTFCGLNSTGMTFRSKSSEKAFSELKLLLEKYPVVHVDAVDNILDMAYLGNLCQKLASEKWDVSIYFEVKANLRRDQIRLLRDAGVLRVQPGIESLSSNILRLMSKGSTSLINLRFLKWARYYDLRVMWNILAGFPGEGDQDYAYQTSLMPFLWHLEPPGVVSGVWLERFSPYFTQPNPDITNVRPRAAYRFIYPETVDLSRAAYFFEYDGKRLSSLQVRADLAASAETWRRRAERRPEPFFNYQKTPSRLRLVDGRSEGAVRTIDLDSWMAESYLACDSTYRSAKALYDSLELKDKDVSSQQLDAFLNRGTQIGIFASDDDQFFGLALPENPTC